MDDNQDFQEEITKFLASGELSQALLLCQKACELYPDDPRFLMLEITCRIQSGDLSGAKLSALKASRLVSSEPSIYEILGRLTVAEGDDSTGSNLIEYAERLEQYREPSKSVGILAEFAEQNELWETALPCFAQDLAFSKHAIPIMISLEIWGEIFVEMFFAYNVPSLLQPNNIPALAQTGRKIIVTLSLPIADYLYIKDDPRLLPLRQFAEIRFSVIKHPTPGLVKYDALKTIQNYKLRKAAAEYCYYCWMSPDALLGDGALETALETIERNNKLAFFCYAPRAEQEAFNKIAMPNSNPEELFDFLRDRRLVVKTVMENLHAGEACKNVNATSFTSWPHCVHWTVPGQGVAVRAFHMHPILLHPKLIRNMPAISITLDNDLIASIDREFNDTEISVDSDEFFFFSVSSKTDESVLLPDTTTPYSREQVRNWLEQFCSPFNLYLASFPLRFKWADTSETAWSKEERNSASLHAWLEANTRFKSN